MHIRHRMLRCRTCLTYNIDIRCRTCTTYDIVRVQCHGRTSTCTTYDIVCNIGFIRCRTSDVRHSTSAIIQMCSKSSDPGTPAGRAQTRQRRLVTAGTRGGHGHGAVSGARPANSPAPGPQLEPAVSSVTIWNLATPYIEVCFDIEVLRSTSISKFLRYGSPTLRYRSSTLRY